MECLAQTLLSIWYFSHRYAIRDRPRDGAPQPTPNDAIDEQSHQRRQHTKARPAPPSPREPTRILQMPHPCGQAPTAHAQRWDPSNHLTPEQGCNTPPPIKWPLSPTRRDPARRQSLREHQRRRRKQGDHHSGRIWPQNDLRPRFPERGPYLRPRCDAKQKCQSK